VRAHHGSVSHEQRAEIEDGLKRGTLKAIVATSSLEMGIDMGGVDQVLLVESPGSVARGLQRVGRAGHGVGEVSTGASSRSSAATCSNAPSSPGACCGASWSRFACRATRWTCWRSRSPPTASRRARRRRDPAPGEARRPLPRAGRGALEAVLDMLSGRFPSSDFADLRRCWPGTAPPTG
jgi:ATP-dependent Lhr-like helicase